MAVGQTEELDGTFAAEDVMNQCADALGGTDPDAALLLAAHDLDVEDFLAVVLTAYPDIELIGCTTLAPLSSASDYSEGSTTLTLFASDVLDFTVGLGTQVTASTRSAARSAVEQATHKTDKPPAMMIVTPTVENLDPAAFTNEMGRVLGPTVPVLGGGALPDLPVASPWVGGLQFYGNQVVTDSLPALLISGPLNVSVGVAHGWNPVGKSAIVTRADQETVYEIDGEPVLDFYRHYLGINGEPAIANPLAILDEDTERYYLRAPMAYDREQGTVTFLGSIPQGATVQLTMATTDEILDGTNSSLGEALAGFPEGAIPEGALVVSCAVRNLLLGSRARGEIERIRMGIGADVPVTGFYSFGEIAPLGLNSSPRFHNETCVTALLGT